MRWPSGFVFATLGMLIFAIVSRGAQAETDPIAAPAQEIDQIISEIQVGLVRAQSKAASRNLPRLAEVSLELETEFAYGAGGELKLYVVTLGGTVEKDRVQHIALTLKPPEPYAEEQIAEGDISEQLSGAILAAAQGVEKARHRKPALQLSKLEAEIRFVVTQKAEGGAKLAILPISAELKGDLSKTATQIIKVTFTAPTD